MGAFSATPHRRSLFAIWCVENNELDGRFGIGRRRAPQRRLKASLMQPRGKVSKPSTRQLVLSRPERTATCATVVGVVPSPLSPPQHTTSGRHSQRTTKETHVPHVQPGGGAACAQSPLRPLAPCQARHRRRSSTPTCTKAARARARKWCSRSLFTGHTKVVVG